MKVAVQCESPLLQRSLELFLDGHLASLKQCDVVVRDFKSDDGRPALYIASDETADIVKPFSRAQLYLAIEKILKKPSDLQEITAITDQIEALDAAEPLKSSERDFSILERRIEMLTSEYQKNILEAVRAFYEK